MALYFTFLNFSNCSVIDVVVIDDSIFVMIINGNIVIVVVVVVVVIGGVVYVIDDGIFVGVFIVVVFDRISSATCSCFLCHRHVS